MINRVLRDDPLKSNMHNREGLSVKKIWTILRDWRMWPIYLIGLTFQRTCRYPTVQMSCSEPRL